MKVLIVSTSERTGGAAVAATRLMDALNNNGVEARMLVREKQGGSERVSALRHGWIAKWHFVWERIVILCYQHLRFSKKHLFSIDIANTGTDITRYAEFREADVVHLHWTNHGMLSLHGIRKILRSGKPVVWTMHDMWPATALCHLTLGCRRFCTRCHDCQYLPGGGSATDLSSTVWKRKQKMLNGQTVHFVTCSRWLEGEAKASALLSGQQITNIPNPIDTGLYSPGNRLDARRAEGLPRHKRLLLFVCLRVTNQNKGMQYLIDACQMLSRQHPEMAEDTGVVILGGQSEEVASLLPFEAFPMGYVTDERRLVNIYRAADAFVLPSLSENLPNTIMEAMACGVPCVAFRVGGIPEEIDHLKNGYVANLHDTADLARGIRWTLHEADHDQLGREAVQKVARSYSQASVSLRYIEVYQQAIAQKHFNL